MSMDGLLSLPSDVFTASLVSATDGQSGMAEESLGHPWYDTTVTTEQLTGTQYISHQALPPAIINEMQPLPSVLDNVNSPVPQVVVDEQFLQTLQPVPPGGAVSWINPPPWNNASQTYPDVSAQAYPIYSEPDTAQLGIGLAPLDCKSEAMQLSRQVLDEINRTECSGRRETEKDRLPAATDDQRAQVGTQDSGSMETLARPVASRSKPAIRKQPCPLPDCDKFTSRATRHLEKFHSMSPNAAKLVSNLLKAHNRNSNRQVTQSGRLGDEYKECYICGKYETRLDKHIPKMHNMKYSKEKALKFRALAASSEEENEEEGGMEMHCTARAIGDTSDEDDTSGSESESESPDGEVDSRTEDILDEFKRWIKSPAGGSREKSTAENNTRSCRTALASLGGTIDSVKKYTLLGNPGGLMDKMNKDKKSPMTVRHMLSAVCQLVHFLHVKGYGSLNAEETARATTTLQNYGKSLKKTIKRYRQQSRVKAQEEVEKLLPQMANYTDTDHYNKTKLLIKNVTQDNSMTRPEFLRLKQYIITRLLITNGHRTSVITKCTMSEYQKAKLIEGGRIISIEEHKTSVDGQARLTVLPELWPELAVYVTWRVKMIKDKEFLFPTRYGTEMQSSSLARCLKQALGLATNATLIRKATVVMHAKSGATTEQMGDLSTHMCHRPDVQSTYYEVSRKDETATRVARSIEERLGTFKQSVNESHADSTTDTDGVATTTRRRKSSQAKKARSSSSSPIQHHRRAGYTKNHEKLLESKFLLCAANKARTLPTQKDVGEWLTENPGIAENFKHFTTKQLADKARNMSKKDEDGALQKGVQNLPAQQ
jgi:hypothetical protein